MHNGVLACYTSFQEEQVTNLLFIQQLQFGPVMRCAARMIRIYARLRMLDQEVLMDNV